MWQAERHQRILSLLASFNQVSTDRLAAELGVSRETVRRDLVELEALGDLKRVHGGAIRLQEDAEPPIAIRASVRVKEKRAIARAATRLVAAGQTLFLDAGSTTAILAEELAGLSGLTVITNSVDVAMKLSEPPSRQRSNTAILIGGRMGTDVTATFGATAIAEIRRYRATMALLSPVGLDARYGATDYHLDEAEVARAMAESAERTVILADHSKLGLVSRVSYCATDSIHCLITDGGAVEAKGFQALKDSVNEIILA